MLHTIVFVTNYNPSLTSTQIHIIIIKNLHCGFSSFIINFPKMLQFIPLQRLVDCLSVEFLAN